MQFALLPILSSKDNNSLDFIDKGLLETYHTIDTTDECADYITRIILAALSKPVSYFRNSSSPDINNILKLTGYKFYSGYEYVPLYDRDEEIEQSLELSSDNQPKINSFRKITEAESKYHKIYIKFDFNDSNEMMGNKLRILPKYEEFKQNI